MIKLSRTKKIYILGGLALATIVAGIIFGAMPLYQNIINLNSENHDKRVQLAIFQQERSNLEKTQHDFSKIKNDIENISQIFISNEQIRDVISDLEDISVNNNLIQEITVLSETNQSFSSSLDMKIVLNCEWQNCLNYLGDLEKLNYYLDVHDIDFTSNNENIIVTFISSAYDQEEK